MKDVLLLLTIALAWAEAGCMQRDKVAWKGSVGKLIDRDTIYFVLPTSGYNSCQRYFKNATDYGSDTVVENMILTNNLDASACKQGYDMCEQLYNCHEKYSAQKDQET